MLLYIFISCALMFSTADEGVMDIVPYNDFLVRCLRYCRDYQRNGILNRDNVHTYSEDFNNFVVFLSYHCVCKAHMDENPEHVVRFLFMFHLMYLFVIFISGTLSGELMTNFAQDLNEAQK